MVYRIAVDISPTILEAEEIFISVFEKVHKQNLIARVNNGICAKIIKLTIQEAHKQLNIKDNIKLSRFENSPLLHEILCREINVDTYCQENKLSKMEVAERVREEFNQIRKLAGDQPAEKELLLH